VLSEGSASARSHSGAARAGPSNLAREGCVRKEAGQPRAQQAGAAEETTGVRAPPAGPAACQTFYVVIIGGRATTGTTQAHEQHGHDNTTWHTQTNNATSDARTPLHAGPSGLKWTHRTYSRLTACPYCRHTPWALRSPCSDLASMLVPPRSVEEASVLSVPAKTSASVMHSKTTLVARIAAQAQSSPPAASGGKS